MPLRNSFLAICLLISSICTAQLSENAIGLRNPPLFGFLTNISYQRAVAEMERVQLDIGFDEINSIELFYLMATYQWVKPLEIAGPDFNWFYGGGASIGFANNNEILLIDNPSQVIYLEGIIGIEYSLVKSADLPFVIALDLNPGINLFNNAFDGLDPDLALSARWIF